MNKYFLMILFFVFSMISINCEIISGNEKELSQSDSSDATLILELAYKHNSQELLDYFFSRWAYDNLIHESNIEDTTIQNVYKIFEDIYKPDTLSKTGFLNQLKNLTYETDTTLLKNFVFNTSPFYRDAEYIVIQNSINYKIISNFDSLYSEVYSDEEEMKTVKEFEVTNFRPKINYFNKKVLYSSQKYFDLLDRFLLREYREQSLIQDSVIYVENMDKDIERLFGTMHLKRSFLSPKIQTAKHHWGTGWYYNTFPFVYYIIFNMEMNKAVVSFRDNWNTGGKILYKKINDIWIQDKSISEWIE